MKKSFLVLIVSLLSLMIFVACGSEDVVDDTEEITILDFDIEFIEFIETSNIVAVTTGYTTTAQLGRRTYMFRTNDEAANTNFINIVEIIAQGLEQFIAIPDTQIRINASQIDLLDHIFTHNELSLNFGGNDTLGRFTHVVSRGNLPIWPSVGLEAYIMGNNGMFSSMSNEPQLVEHFGDFLFSPYMWYTTENAMAVDIAYLFVKHLSESDSLNELIALYMNGDSVSAGNLSEELFLNHFGYQMNTTITLNFLGAMAIDASIAEYSITFAVM
ncbi:MAG: hypothetical protein FWE34_01440 [Defluviitaleaceae bacterium]|nr:hypothetical protein [Defluviitaleaceae bacterium]